METLLVAQGCKEINVDNPCPPVKPVQGQGHMESFHFTFYCLLSGMQNSLRSEFSTFHSFYVMEAQPLIATMQKPYYNGKYFGQVLMFNG